MKHETITGRLNEEVSITAHKTPRITFMRTYLQNVKANNAFLFDQHLMNHGKSITVF